MKLFLCIVAATIIGCSSTKTNEKFGVLNALDYTADADCVGAYKICVSSFATHWCIHNTEYQRYGNALTKDAMTYCNFSAWETSCAATKNVCLHDCMTSCSVHINRNHQVAFDACQRSCIGND
jgi:hypothetical protein